MKCPMKHLAALALFLSIPLATQAADPGLTTRPSPYAVAETLDRLESVLKAKGVKVFARIDHAAEARAAGLELKPMQLLIFGNPKAGTPLMRAAPTTGLDLPMKALAWQDDGGQTQVTWNSPAHLIDRHGLDPAQGKSLAAVAGLIDAALK